MGGGWNGRADGDGRRLWIFHWPMLHSLMSLITTERTADRPAKSLSLHIRSFVHGPVSIIMWLDTAVRRAVLWNREVVPKYWGAFRCACTRKLWRFNSIFRHS